MRERRLRARKVAHSSFTFTESVRSPQSTVWRLDRLAEFYSEETKKRKHEVYALTDVAGKLAKALAQKSTKKMSKYIESAAKRCLSRLEFLAAYTRLGPKGAAAIEESLLDNSLPKETVGLGRNLLLSAPFSLSS